MPKFGGLRGGKPRKDGLAPGSPEALEADRKKDKLRKRAERKPDPAPLPPAGGVESQVPPTPGSVGPVPGPDGAPVIPWDAESLQEICGLIIPTAEEMMTGQIINQAHKARLPASMVKELEDGVKFTPREKQALEKFAPRAAAKWLNRLHVPSGTQDEIVLVTVVAKIGLRHVKLLNRLKELTATQDAAKVNTAKPAEGKKA